ncbi:hypothetical protein TrVE_jg13986 [Triparma verrucosa]|uniref:Uncharacterized protein n=1 Tax=Triparma verrucosa TaxID=1606542 RepID=A0A9W7KUH4_9STRA|nr:hypothetical protein TrVE_jg13986 [Triparma verrucosa]
MSSSKIQPALAGAAPNRRPSMGGVRRSFTAQLNKFGNLPNLALIMGAAMSFSDLAFDMVMIIEYFRYSIASAYATIGTIILSLFFQCCVVLVAHRMRKKRYIFRELLYVVTCVKPGVDAYRVVTKQPLPVGAMVTAHEEMMYHRGVELFIECVPGCLIQAIAYVNTQQTTVATLSLLSSILTAAFISASTTIEKDAKPKYRETFMSFKTGSQHVIGTFRTATNERVKIGVMNNHRSLWKEIEEDVRVWLNENLEKWIEEEQEWFNDSVKAMVLDDLVDDPSLLKVLKNQTFMRLSEGE